MDKDDTAGGFCLGFLCALFLCIVLPRFVPHGNITFQLTEWQVTDVIGQSYTGIVSADNDKITISVDNPYIKDASYRCKVSIPHTQVAKIERVKTW